MIGNDIPALVRTAKALQQLPVAAIDLNLGCPAPIVYRKCAGGGLLREPDRIDAILGALRDAVQIKFTVKTRLGFASAEEFDRLLPIFARHSLDALTVHGRTVAQLYRLPVDYDRIRQAADDDAVSGDRQRACPLGGAGAGGADAHRGARPDDRAGRDPQSVAVQPDPPATARRDRDPADRTRRRGLHPRAVGLAGLLRQAGKGAVRADEEVPELSRRRRAGAVPPPDSPHADRGGLPPHLRASSSTTTSRWHCRRRS